MFYARCMLPNLTACIHSPYSYILCVPEAKMAARTPPTPSPRVTATGVDSVGPIGRAQTGIDFHPRMGDRWAYLEVCTPTRISCLHLLQWGFCWFQVRLGRKAKILFLGPDIFWPMCLFHLFSASVSLQNFFPWIQFYQSSLQPFCNLRAWQSHGSVAGRPAATHRCMGQIAAWHLQHLRLNGTRSEAHATYRFSRTPQRC